ncbi:methyltransferase domain [Diplodia corticola]|uniref:Methyltransferase domain n=1 Tax=Diplodia corticola TaxID=236234 RepID=A0A1J9RYR2_9PEZI|nr:methyltransferase domain [Diplodia corticola]OJD32948.1 methyltransferase domain [Diplodia corticola]
MTGPGPASPLPLPPPFAAAGDVDGYVAALLRFGTTSTTLRTLCGGVHILDFFTRDPDLYALVLPAAWRRWFARDDVDVGDVLDLLMRDDLDGYGGGDDGDADAEGGAGGARANDGAAAKTTTTGGGGSKWGEGPPGSLLAFVREVRGLLLRREWQPTGTEKSVRGKGGKVAGLPRHIALGMNVKKQHEVQHFAAFVDRLTEDIAKEKEGPDGEAAAITHIADFGSGQNYLGRALASEPYGKNIIGIESRRNNIEGAKGIDVLAGLAPKKVVLRNKKEWRKEKEGAVFKEGGAKKQEDCEDCGEAPEETNGEETAAAAQPASEEDAFAGFAPEGTADFAQSREKEAFNGVPKGSKKAKLHLLEEGGGSIQYVEHRLEDGNLGHVIQEIVDPAKVQAEQGQGQGQGTTTTTPCVTASTRAQDPRLMVISLHSCGNLVHHGLRSLTLNPNVKAVCMIGCCYNLMTERLGPPSYKLPQLRPNHPRLEATANAFDPHGFPMSTRYATYPVPGSGNSAGDVGVRLNITARMMAVQAPQNWGPVDSEAFFTRHFFRALLQRVFLDRGVVEPPPSNGRARDGDSNGDDDGDQLHPRVLSNGRTVSGSVSPAGCSSGGEPIVIGSLKKSCYADFVAYVRGALAKIEANPDQRERAGQVRDKMRGITDEEIARYERDYRARKKELAVVWSLMAFAAGVVEAMIVVDRWLWLTEQPEVERAWVEPVFDYALSPRNLVVVGLKK